jgi:hypothetical protein
MLREGERQEEHSGAKRSCQGGHEPGWLSKGNSQQCVSHSFAEARQSTHRVGERFAPRFTLLVMARATFASTILENENRCSRSLTLPGQLSIDLRR